jgi:hypothetical protein
MALTYLDDYCGDEDRGENDRWPLLIGPDHNHKYFVSGGGPNIVRVPCLAADVILDDEWLDTTFVGYLRECFKWGGFPGLRCAPKPPADELALLTRDLLRI